MKEKKSFVLYHDFGKIFGRLTDPEAGILIKAIFDYVLGEGVPTFDGALGMGFDIIENQLDRDYEKWEEMCRKRSLAGRKSAAVKRAEKDKCSTNATRVDFVEHKSTLATDNENDNDNENVDVDESEDVSSPAHAHGIHHNVMLTNGQLDELKRRYPQDWHAHIDNLSGYMQSTGKTYADHYATLLRWAAQDAKRPPVTASRKPRGHPLPTAVGRPPSFDPAAYDAMTMRHTPLAFEEEKEQ